MPRFLIVVLAASCVAAFAPCADAQSDAAGPLATPVGPLQFTRDGRGFMATLDGAPFDRFAAATLTHFDDVGTATGTDRIPRMLVLTDTGPVVYDLRRRPPEVERTGRRIAVRRVFWQRDEIVMQGPQGWFRFEHGTLTPLQSRRRSTTNPTLS